MWDWIALNMAPFIFLWLTLSLWLGHWMGLREASKLTIDLRKKEIVLLAEVNRLTELLEPKLVEMHIKNGSANMQIEGGIMHFFAAHFAEYFRNCEGAENYIEMQAHSTDPEIGPLVLTLQRLYGKTPHQLRMEAEAKLEKMKDEANVKD